MPIRPELRHFYGREWRTVVRPRILARAENKCELCRAPNHKDVLRAFAWWTIGDRAAIEYKHRADRPLTKLVWRCEKAEQFACFPRESTRWVRIVLTVAHLNHQAGDDRDENLKALCQWCHLNYDKEHHAETRATRKDGARPLLALQEIAKKANEECAAEGRAETPQLANLNKFLEGAIE